MIKPLCSLLLLLAALNSAGQSAAAPGPVPASAAADHLFTVEGEGFYDSDALHNDLVLGLLQGGFISRDTRMRSLDDIGGTGRAGYVLNGRASYAWGDSLFHRAGWRPRISVGLTTAMGVLFTEDAYRLTFFGNSDLEGLTAHLGPSRYEQVTWRSIGFGVEDRNSGSFVELAIVSGQQLSAADLRKADLYTAVDGRYLDLDLDGEYWASDTAGHPFGGSNGLGASIAAQWDRPLHLFGQESLLRIGVRDLGLVRWNRNAVHIRNDSPLHYTGFQVEDILDLDGLFTDRASIQDSLGLGFEQGSHWRMLPAYLSAEVEFGRDLLPGSTGQRRAYAFILDQYLLPGFLPHASLSRIFKLTDALHAGINMGYGGFGGLRFGAGLEYRLGCVQFRLRTSNAVGLLSKEAEGGSAMLGVSAGW